MKEKKNSLLTVSILDPILKRSIWFCCCLAFIHACLTGHQNLETLEHTRMMLLIGPWLSQSTNLESSQLPQRFCDCTLVQLKTKSPIESNWKLKFTQILSKVSQNLCIWQELLKSSIQKKLEEAHENPWDGEFPSPIFYPITLINTFFKLFISNLWTSVFLPFSISRQFEIYVFMYHYIPNNFCHKIERSWNKSPLWLIFYIICQYFKFILTKTHHSTKIKII